jgi:xylulokinase
MDEKVATILPGSDNLIFTPWMYGERAPIDDCYVRAGFLNLSGSHTREAMVRAVYEGVAYNLRWILEIVEQKFNFPLPTLRVIGGGAKSATWMQILADVTHRRIETVREPMEAGARGVALVAAAGMGVYPGFESLKKVVKLARVYQPQKKNEKTYDFIYQSYKQVYANLREFYRQLNSQRVR